MGQLTAAKISRMIIKAKHYRRATIIEFLRTELKQLRIEERLMTRVMRELEWEQQLFELQTQVNEENKT